MTYKATVLDGYGEFCIIIMWRFLALVEWSFYIALTRERARDLSLDVPLDKRRNTCKYDEPFRRGE